MDNEFENILKKSKVNDDTLKKLVNDELCTADDLLQCSDELLKACGIPGGQIIKMKTGCKAFVEKHATANLPLLPVFPSSLPSSLPSSPSTAPLTPISSMPSSPSSSISTLESTPSSSSTVLTPSSSPSLAFSNHSLSRKSSPKGDSSWLKDFQLPCTFSPGVLEELGNKTMSGDRRNEFMRDICSAIRVNTLFPSKSEREQVAFMGSWEAAIMYRFKDMRKSKKRPAEKSDRVHVQPKIKAKKRCETESLEVQQDETEETCIDHIKMMKKEMAKHTNKNYAIIKDLMQITFAFRRNKILCNPIAISDVVDEYPALQLPTELKAEFARVFGGNPSKKIKEGFRATWLPKILKYMQSMEKQKDCRSILVSLKDAIEDEPGRKTEIEEAAAVQLLSVLLKEKGGAQESFLKICSDDESIDEMVEKSTSPRLIGSGDALELDPLYIAVEGRILVQMPPRSSMCYAITLLIATFYVFNVQYPPKCSNIYLFFEAIFLENDKEAKKRVAVNKLISALQKF